MSNLIPQARVNKNGVSVIKHVRPDQGSKLPRPLKAPAPSVAPVVKAQIKAAVKDVTAVYPCQDRSNEVHLSEKDYAPSKRLLDHLCEKNERFANSKDYYFYASDVEAYSVLSKVNADDAIPLLSTGAESAEDAVRVLTEAGLAKLIEDNSDLTDEAMKRGIPAKAFFECFSEHWQTLRDDPEEFFDKAQSKAERFLNVPINRTKGGTTLQDLIDGGDINIADIRAVGAERLWDAIDEDLKLVEALKSMKSGTCLYTAEDLDRWVAHFDLSDGESRRYSKKNVYYLGDRQGAEYVDGLPRDLTGQVFILGYIEGSVKMNLDANTERAYIDYARETSEEIARVTKELSNLRPEDYRDLILAGVSPEQAAQGVSEGLNTAHIIAIKKHGISPPVAEGWL